MNTMNHSSDGVRMEISTEVVVRHKVRRLAERLGQGPPGLRCRRCWAPPADYATPLRPRRCPRRATASFPRRPLLMCNVHAPIAALHCGAFLL
jgi:hypothetical protein